MSGEPYHVKCGKTEASVGCVADDELNRFRKDSAQRASGTLSSTCLAAASRRLASNGRRSSAIATRRRKSRRDRASGANPAADVACALSAQLPATSPARRAPVTRGIERPHARSNAAITSSTDVAAPLPRFTRHDAGVRAECASARRDEAIGEILHMHVVAHARAVRACPSRRRGRRARSASPAATRHSAGTRCVGRLRGASPSIPDECAPAGLNLRTTAIRQFALARRQVAQEILDDALRAAIDARRAQRRRPRDRRRSVASP